MTITKRQNSSKKEEASKAQTIKKIRIKYQYSKTQPYSYFYLEGYVKTSIKVCWNVRVQRQIQRATQKIEESLCPLLNV